MSSNTIYAPIEPIFSAISRNPGLAGSLVSAFESHRNGNPSVINKHFRVLLEAAGVNYHKQGYSPKEIYYRIIHNDWGDHNCEICGKPINVFRKLEDGFTRFCSAKHAAIAESTKKARKNTVQELYGVDNVWHNSEVQLKAKSALRAKYGVDHPLQSCELHNKSMNYNCKLYTFPSGAVVKIQGYEDRAIDQLLAEGYKETEIQVTGRQSIRYFWNSEDGFGDDKWHVYHPDIVIPRERRIIEVKSTWTFNGRPSFYARNKAKEKACIAAGFKFEFWVF